MATKNTKPNVKAGKGVNETSNIMVTLPLAIRKQVETLAETEERSMSYLCRQFIEQGLNEKNKKPRRK